MSAVRVRHRPPAFAPGAVRLASHPYNCAKVDQRYRWSKRTSIGGLGAGRRRDCKGTARNDRACRHTASLSSLAARKATFLLALIWIGSPLAGLRPLRAARLPPTRLPRPPDPMRPPL